MAKEKESTIVLDEEAINSQEPMIPVSKEDLRPEPKPHTNVTRISEGGSNLVNCLRNEKVIVRFIAKARGTVTDPRHVLFGGMARGSKIRFTTPLLRTGGYANVLTTDEKNYLEYVLGLEPNALSVHNRTNNFWDDANEHGIGRVELIKGDNPLDLSDPMDYIRYKILLANKNEIAPSMHSLQDRPKATYRFVIVSENDAAKVANVKVTLKAQAFMEFGKINEDREKMRVIIETIDGRPTSKDSKIEYLQGKIGELIEANTKIFLQVVRDPLLSNKVLVKRAIEAGIISNRGNYLYLREGNLPLCENGEEPTLNIAAKYLSLPKNQELKFSIEAKLKQ
jgi:hypothetical protein